MFENIIYSLKKYSYYAWKRNTALTFIIWTIITFGLYIEPLFIAKAVSFLEEYYNTKELDIEWIYKTFGLWIVFTIILWWLHYYHRYYLVDVPCLDEEVWEFQNTGNKVMKMKYWDYLSQKPWELYKDLDRWLASLFQINFVTTQEYFRAIIWLVFISVVMFFINWQMALAALSLTPVVAFIWLSVIKNTVKIQKTVHKEWSAAYWTLWNFITNLQVVKNFAIQNKVKDTLRDKIVPTSDKQKVISKRWSFSSIYTNIVIILWRMLVLGVWLYLIYNNQTSFAEIILFITLIAYIYMPISFIFQNMRSFQDNLTSLQTYRDKFENMDLEEDSENAVELKNVKWEISLQDVWFSYNKDRMIFENLNLTITPWEKVALVGHTGSWKSTITNLILRLWDVNSWAIKIDWTNIKEITYKSLREHIWIVSQDNSLFNWTILENMQMIKSDASLEDIENALRKAKADFVFDLKDWINSEIWERGLKLSGWEKQRIAIARVFLKNPEIFILDEATSALDNKTEVQIQEALDDLMKNKTSIIIAHRLSTIKNVDRIIMLENWKLIEEWTYDELISKWGKFAQMANPDKLILN